MIHIIYSANDKYFKMLYLSLLSCVRRTKEDICFHILSMDVDTKKKSFKKITVNQIEFLKETVKKYNINNQVKYYDLTEIYASLLGNGANKNSTYSPYCMLRLLTDKVFDLDYIEKAIYLDTDTMVNKDISLLSNIDISNYDYAACIDVAGSIWFGNTYINSGVLYINYKSIKETKLFDRCLEFIKKYYRILPDQDALNYCNPKKLIIDKKFNEQRNMKNDTVIKHFCKAPHLFPPKIVNIKQTEIDKVHSILKIFDFDDDFKIYLENVNDPKLKDILI